MASASAASRALRRLAPALRAPMSTSKASPALSVRAMATSSGGSRGKKSHDESATAASASASSGEVPVESHKSGESGMQASDKPSGEMQRGGTRRRSAPASAGAMAPFLGGGLASVLPRMMMTPTLPGMLAGGDPFSSLLAPLRSGPFGVADRLLHELEDDMRTLTQSMMGGGDVAETDETGALAQADLMPGRLWAAVDVKETPNEFVLSTDVPGLRKDDVKITVQDGVLMITGERKREETKEEEGFKRVERSYGMFERRFKLPNNVSESEGIKASMDHGVLSVTLPKREESKAKPISISVGGSAAGGEQGQGQGGAAGGQKAMEG